MAGSDAGQEGGGFYAGQVARPGGFYAGQVARPGGFYARQVARQGGAQVPNRHRMTV